MFVQGPADRLPLDRLESQITELAAHIAAATCRWLSLVAEFDRRQGWERWGCRSCAHWLSWRCGLALSAARERVRVARCLGELPRIHAIFARGELSYSQVRALSRVATPDTEDCLLEIARHSTAAQLELIVRNYRGVLATQRPDPEAAAEARQVNWWQDDDGSLILQARLPAEEGALVLAALDAARDHLYANATARDAASPDSPLRGTNPEDAPGSPDAGSVPAGSPSADSPPAGPMTAGADTAASTLEDVSAETPRERRRPDRADALLRMAESFLSATPSARSGGERNSVVVHVDVDVLADDAAPGRCELERGGRLHPETARRLGCDAGLVRILERDGKPLSVGRRTRTIPPALRRALTSRDGGCRFPGCAETRYVDAHHIRHWATGGRTDLTNLVQLCGHHHRLVHEGGYTVQRRRHGQLTFHRPDGREIPQRPTPQRRGDPHEITHHNHRAGLHITPETSVPHWLGDHLDLVNTISAIAERDSRLVPP